MSEPPRPQPQPPAPAPVPVPAPAPVPPQHAAAVRELHAHIQAAALPAAVQDNLLQLLRQFGPLALHYGVKLLEAGHPGWAAFLDPLEAALLKVLPAVAPAG